VTHTPVVRQRLGEQTCNKYATNNRIDPLLSNARSTRTQQQNGCCKSCFLCGSAPWPLLSNDLVNIFKRIRNYRRRPLLGNGRVFREVRHEAMYQWVTLAPGGVIRSRECPVGFVKCRNELYKGPINSIIKSKTRSRIRCNVMPALKKLNSLNNYSVRSHCSIIFGFINQLGYSLSRN
jgi:hypothetical protein